MKTNQYKFHINKKQSKQNKNDQYVHVNLVWKYIWKNMPVIDLIFIARDTSWCNSQQLVPH